MLKIDGLNDIKLFFSLLRILVKKDLVTRYQRSILGIWWSLINPTLTALILFLVFNSTYSQKFSGQFPFGPYVLGGTLIISFLANGVVVATQNLQSSAFIFTRLPSPPPIFAFSSALVLATNLVFGLVPLLIWNVIAGGEVSVYILLLPIFLLFSVLFITGMALIFFIAVIRVGDVINLMTLGASLLMFLTPVFYPIESVSYRGQLILELNPITHYLNIFRFLTIGYGNLTTTDVAWCVSSSLLALILGQILFMRTWKRSVTLI